MSRFPRPVLLSIPDFTLYNPSIEAVCPRTVDPHLGVKFRRLKSFNQPAECASAGVLRRENVPAPISTGGFYGRWRDECSR